MVAKPTAKRATYEDVLAAHEHLVAEVIDGVLYTNPRPAAPHARAASVLGGSVMGPFDFGDGGPGGWIILFEPELHLGDDIVVPDLAGWRRERLPEVGRGAYFTLAPDWCCEVLSPGTARIDRSEKSDVYLHAGVHFYWIVEPLVRTVEAFRRGEGGSGAWIRTGAWHDDAKVRIPPFDALELDLARLWA